MKSLRILLLILALGLGFLGGYWFKDRFERSPAPADKSGRKILHWICPMHPAYKSASPGSAPCCGMKLEPVYADEGLPPPAPKGRVLYWRDPQNPEYRSDKPGLNPETGNELEPVYQQEPALPPGTVQISPEKQQLIGVRFGVAEIKGGVWEIRALGRVTYDETRLAKVHTRVEGWIEKVFVDFTGKAVAKGDPLLTIYSPEMLASQRELLLAVRARQLMSASTLDRASDRSEALVEAARRRLELWDLSAAQIDEVLRTGRPIRNVTLYAPASGYVLERKAFPSARVTPEMDLYTLADLSRVWILAEVFESEAPLVRLGQAARVRPTHLPGRGFQARVSYIQPQFDPATRTLKARLEADNPDLVLKPEMFVDVDLKVVLPPRLTVPAAAVLDTGERRTVFVDRGQGYFEPRAVETGERLGERVVILKGLKPGERVVTSGNFLIDSESQLKAAAAAITPADPSAGAPAPTHQHD